MAGSSWRLANSLITIRNQINALYPARSKASDGTIGDAAHAAGLSDHNPNGAGVVTAIDITQDPNNGVEIQTIANALINSNDPRIKYIICNRKIWLSGKWQNYYGDNPHIKHIHISVSGNSALYDDARQWQITEGEDMARIAELEQRGRDLEAQINILRPDLVNANNTIKSLYEELDAERKSYEATIEQLKSQLVSQTAAIENATKTAQTAAPVATKAPWFVRFLSSFTRKK